MMWPPTTGGLFLVMASLIVLNDTIFKTSIKQSRELPASEKVLVAGGRQFDLHSHEPAPENHVKIALLGAAALVPGRNVWYAYGPHVRIEGNEPDNQPSDLSKPKPVLTGPFNLSGFESTFYLSGHIHKGGNFTWAEATKNGTRIPNSREIVENILAIADVMDEIRELFGNRPIIVTSWYRDPATNRRVGGSSRSRHMKGDAVDFVVQGIKPNEVQRRLDPWWGSRGGLASASSFTHIDKRGYRARWDYGF